MCFGEEVREVYEKLLFLKMISVDARIKDALEKSIDALITLGAKDKNKEDN
jgi:hypothetical protein